ncbi:hypothetical protein FA13DRAFT_1736404 [Coprinellus micaceus]|uniref:Fungal-type protein kinase domain-containing protein n=1 Tax=Coprinellus micaceus TaxID=71717 RepID=A0A4Y7T0V3_COPMI|nr:hypothetical protein FA13DRAFT_1736404 [Coprinellus micaceus]
MTVPAIDSPGLSSRGGTPSVQWLIQGVKAGRPDSSKQLSQHINQHYSATIIEALVDSFQVPSVDGLETTQEDVQSAWGSILCLSQIVQWQIFAYQPNRRFVRCFLISGKHVQLVQFDAAGTHAVQPSRGRVDDGDRDGVE